MNRLFGLPNQYNRFEDDLEPLIEITELEDELCQRFKWSDKTQIEEIIQNLKSTSSFSDECIRMFPRSVLILATVIRLNKTPLLMPE